MQLTWRMNFVIRENKDNIERLIEQLITQLGEDVARPGLKDTPVRVAAAYQTILEGYSRNFQDEITTFDNLYSYDDIIYSGKIDFFSLCEHHLLPFFGTAHIAYIPNQKIIGLSKLARAVDIYSRRLQDQERITIQVANELVDSLNPKGVVVMLHGRHFCNMARGVEKVNSDMKTIVARGCFKEDPILYDRFFKLVDQG